MACKPITGLWFGTWLDYFSIYWEYSSQLTHIFQRGWNHQPALTRVIYWLYERCWTKNHRHGLKHSFFCDEVEHKLGNVYVCRYASNRVWEEKSFCKPTTCKERYPQIDLMFVLIHRIWIGLNASDLSGIMRFNLWHFLKGLKIPMGQGLLASCRESSSYPCFLYPRWNTQARI